MEKETDTMCGYSNTWCQKIILWSYISYLFFNVPAD